MSNFWRGRRVLITGQTGFKGAWLALWLIENGAHLAGIALKPATSPNLYDILNLHQCGNFIFADICDEAAIEKLIAETRPEIIIHMAAQALVRPSYSDPVGTFMTNAMGTAVVLNAARKSTTTRAILVITTDKVYEPVLPRRPYEEGDRLGGIDPYSASKAASEIVVQSFRNCFYQHDQSDARIATVRAGNVIGGGDWSQDRIIPDIIRGALSSDGSVTIRNPHSIRPWQHVLDVLNAYLNIAERLFHHEPDIDRAWNIGPIHNQFITVEDIAKRMISRLGKGRLHFDQSDQPHEEAYLALNSEKAITALGWEPRLDMDETLQFTADWYQAWNANEDMATYSRRQLANFAGR